MGFVFPILAVKIGFGNTESRRNPTTKSQICRSSGEKREWIVGILAKSRNGTKLIHHSQTQTPQEKYKLAAVS